MTPGTYPSLEDFQVDKFNKQILVFSNEKKSLLRYSLDGKYIDENKLPFYGWLFVVLDSTHLAFFLNQNTDEITGEYNLMITDRRGNIIQKLFAVNLPRMAFDYTGFLQQCDSGALFSEPFSDTISEIKANRIKKLYSVSFGDKAFLQKPKKNDARPINDFLDFSFLLSSIFSSEHYTVFFFNEDRRRKIAVLNKTTGQLIKVTETDFDLYYGLIGNIIGVSDDKFFSVLDITFIQSKIKERPDLLNRLELLDMNLANIVKDTVPFRNPVIMTFKFKF